MMSPGGRQERADKAARHARHNGYRPVIVTEETKAQALRDLAQDRRPTLQVPFLGDYVPEGFVPTETVLFVDTSGFGGPFERALTVEQFVQALRPGYAYAMIEAGQFQAYVQEFVPPKTKRGGE